MEKSYDLINRFNDGDEEALHELFKLHYRMLFHYSAKITKSHEDAEEIVAEGYVRLFQLRQKGKRFETEKHILNFLYMVIRNDSINMLGYKRRHAKKEMPEDSLITFPMMDNDRIESEMMQLIYTAAESLPKECKRIFRMFFIEELPTKEIALALNLSRQTVLNQKTRAIKLIKQHIYSNKNIAIAGLALGLTALVLYLLGFISVFN
jgi:RNA polymerase sigma-70 factor (ECF subfamily)